MEEHGVGATRSNLAYVKYAIRITVFALVAYGLWRFVSSSWNDVRQSLLSADPAWLGVSMLLYSVGMVPMGLFWWRVLKAMGQDPTVGETLRAFFVGHLGKYVPGKALVVVLRTGLIHSHRTDKTMAATSVFIETLTMMASGACVAGMTIAVLYRDQWQMLVLAGGLMLATGVPTIPPLFRRIVSWLKVRNANPAIERALEGVNARVMAIGWCCNLVGWVFFALSLWAVMRSMGVDAELGVLPRLAATVALAMVAGFLSLLPGGIGVREWVVMSLLVAPIGPFEKKIAVSSALLLRFVWMLSEVAISVILYLWGKRPSTH